MITVYIQSSCSSSRQIVRWLDEHKLPYKTQNINTKPLTKEELFTLLHYTENGVYDLISTRSLKYRQLSKRISFDNLSLSAIVSIMIEYPQILKKPLTFNGNFLLIGFNSDTVRTFIPRERRLVTLKDIQQNKEGVKRDE